MQDAYDALTPKQQAFVDHYLKTGNATEAARLSGYKGNDNTLRSVGGENLLKPAIKAAIDERQKPVTTKRRADADDVLDFLSDVINDTVVINPDGCPLATRVRAAELLGKRYGLWGDRETPDETPAHPSPFATLPS